MENGLKHVLERKGWIKEEPDMPDKTEYKVYTKCILPLDKEAATSPHTLGCG